MNLLLIIFTALFATLSTHYLIHKKRFGSIRSSTLVTLIFLALTAFEFEMRPVLQAVCLGGTFVGTSDPQRLSVKQVASAGVIFALFFHFFHHYFDGLGGALGFSAFISCIFIYLIFNKLGKRHRWTSRNI